MSGKQPIFVRIAFRSNGFNSATLSKCFSKSSYSPVCARACPNVFWDTRITGVEFDGSLSALLDQSSHALAFELNQSMGAVQGMVGKSEDKILNPV